MCVTGRRPTMPRAVGFIFPRISMMPSPGISRLAAPVRAATNRVAERRERVVRGGRAAEQRRRRPTTRNGSREDSNHASDRTTCGPRLLSGTMGPPNEIKHFSVCKRPRQRWSVPFAVWDQNPRSGLSARVPNSVWDQLSCHWRFQELNPLNNQVGPVVPENTPGPHQ